MAGKKGEFPENLQKVPSSIRPLCRGSRLASDLPHSTECGGRKPVSAQGQRLYRGASASLQPLRDGGGANENLRPSRPRVSLSPVFWPSPATVWAKGVKYLGAHSPGSPGWRQLTLGSHAAEKPPLGVWERIYWLFPSASFWWQGNIRSGVIV